MIVVTPITPNMLADMCTTALYNAYHISGE